MPGDLRRPFTSCELVGSTFNRCTFGLFKVSGGDWSFVTLAGADLRGSDLSTLDPQVHPDAPRP